VYVSSLTGLEEGPYLGPTIQLQYVIDEELHQYLLTVTREEVSETFDLYADVALVLKERFQADDRNDIQDANEMLVSLEFDTFALDLWVLSCFSDRNEYFSNFSMGFYLGLSSRNG